MHAGYAVTPRVSWALGPMVVDRAEHLISEHHVFLACVPWSVSWTARASEVHGYERPGWR